MIIAAAYVRVSTDEQTDYSPAAQLADIKEYARNNGYHIPEEFIFMDEGISGKRADKRPAFQAMIRQARKNPITFNISSYINLTVSPEIRRIPFCIKPC